MRSLVVAWSDSLEAFLSSCVPDLELNSLLVNIDGSDLEVDANSRHKVVREDIVLANVMLVYSCHDIFHWKKFVWVGRIKTNTYSESDEEGGLSDSRVSNKEHFEKVIATQLRG